MKTEFIYPTQAEINRIEVMARRERARAFSAFLRWVFRRPTRIAPVATGTMAAS